MLTTNDTHTQKSDTASIAFQRNCQVGCTLTLGYWKTHNATFPGGAPPDTTWNLIGAAKEGTMFFLSGQTWYQVFWTAPQGNVYYTLAQQYMAAKLNVLAGASPPAAVSDAMTVAESLFSTYTPAQMDAWKGNNALRQQALAAQGTLGSFNTGLIGPGHCTEDGLSLLKL